MAMRRTRRDAPLEDEDERVATLRALRRMRDMAAEHPRELERERRRTAVATPVESDEEEVEEEEYDDDHVYTSVTKATANGTKPRGSVSFVDDAQRAAVASGGVEPSQHRRNRLETRLEELQRDVASLTMRLRESGAPSHSHKTYRENEEAERVPSRSTRRHRDGETVKSVHETPPQRKESRATTPKAAVWRSEGHPVESTPSPVDQTVRRRKRGHQNPDTSTTGSTGGGRGTRDATRALRELQVIAVERDQLRYELEQVKKALNSMDKKCQDALKWKEAYVKMKTHYMNASMERHISSRIDILVTKTYAALLNVVKTTAVTKRVLMRPPFTFLHKLLTETLSDYGIFTDQQLFFANLVTKEDKAAFLTRALAFVSSAMSNLNEKCVSCLLLVSPIKVLAGLCVEDTLEFLQQLCVVCKSNNTEAKELAAQEVLNKGDAQLYTAGVTFRKGLILMQAIIRAFIRRRVGKRRGGPAGANNQNNRSPTNYGQVPLQLGARFLKELPNGQVVDGEIVDVQDQRYTLRYDQDRQGDVVDEIEMKILLEESRRLQRFRSRMYSYGSRRRDDELSLTGLPDLSITEPTDGPSKFKLVKTSSAHDIDRLSPKQRPSLSRSMSTRPSTGSPPSSPTSEVMVLATRMSRRLSTSTSALPIDEALPVPAMDPITPSTELTPPISDVKPLENGDGAPATAILEDKPWQASLKNILAKGEPDRVVPILSKGKPKRPSPVNTVTSHPETDEGPSSIKYSMMTMAHMPAFPALGIPGKKSLPPVIKATAKRKRPTKGFLTFQSPSPSIRGSTKTRAGGVEPSEEAQSSNQSATHSSAQANNSNSLRIPPMPMNGEIPVDRAFGGAYQSTDQETQEKMALFREIVHRIDGYMKRKRLRVIDLFRFCDADGNGSISPQEMIDTLSQMEINLTPEQAQDFINYIDKDGNGSIDIDEFEELVRVARRNEAQRELLRKELQNSRKGPNEPKSSNRHTVLIKNRQRILDELRSLDVGEFGMVSASQLKSTIMRLQIPGVDDTVLGDLIQRSRAQAGMTDQALGASDSAGDMATVSLMLFTKTLNDLNWTKKSNRFLDQHGSRSSTHNWNVRIATLNYYRDSKHTPTTHSTHVHFA
ncbi:hypothetical protein Poli38472_002892 [Pythium oligandrum]|uniref:EF-hand domain-containing protein n=1 Tax=Pythium oligandrum TaxID=41045 RepID=A0A8K1C6J9_PYTOL|nr:hypothetical protein Poli38472_002892 [Pythium oligandrum]|eukprot:TMW56967.1 hypothetical protein Poli38472_002892 [Pythium oligandrum]